MFTIEGKCGNAACYATNIEDEAVQQIAAMLDMPFAEGAHTAIMPDAHFGKGCTIGTTMRVTDKAVPNLVGVDIGCGMLTADLGTKPIDLAAFDAACHEVPSGRNVWDGRRERFDLEELRCYRALKDTKRIGRSLGSLGGGNHFIEIDRASDGMQRLVIHTGSRNLGLQVAEHYQKLAIDLHRGKEEFFVRKQELIDSYKAAGRRAEIQEALKELSREYNVARPLDAPAELCWLYGTYLEDYLHDVALCQQFAVRNRERIMVELLARTGLDASSVFHTVHNYIDTDEMILRKGAIAAHEGEVVLIPLNMRDGSVIARGRGNEAWNWSAPHGAGRVMSRTAARERLSLDEYRDEMAGVYSTSVCESTLDEAPAAYKPIDDIIGPIAEAVDIIDVMKPIFNFKAS
ncbi:RtcB family protein [uncultured Adlercreutzia sp.]|uniref:RtcB family protein n=1 Tax=uncultured Adlercreutzia sp. TaxID=875803 RepID=UPI0025F7D5A6|nr:RtcB family protein [uncultured Adlercreutzia sp.]